MWAALFGLMLVCSTMTLPARAGAAAGSRGERLDHRAAVEEEVEVAAALDPRLFHARGKPDRGGELRRDRARRLLQGLREVEGGGTRQVAEGDLGRPLEDDALDLRAERFARRRAQRLRDGRANRFQHGARV